MWGCAEVVQARSAYGAGAVFFAPFRHPSLVLHGDHLLALRDKLQPDSGLPSAAVRRANSRCSSLASIFRDAGWLA
jgi:hypothetical protein